MKIPFTMPQVTSPCSVTADQWTASVLIQSAYPKSCAGAHCVYQSTKFKVTLQVDASSGTQYIIVLGTTLDYHFGHTLGFEALFTLPDQTYSSFKFEIDTNTPASSATLTRPTGFTNIVTYGIEDAKSNY